MLSSIATFDSNGPSAEEAAAQEATLAAAAAANQNQDPVTFDLVTLIQQTQSIPLANTTFAVDVSGSTSSQHGYYDVVQYLFGQVRPDQTIGWAADAVEVTDPEQIFSLNEAKKIINYGDTVPHNIFSFHVQDLLVIITDGSVNNGRIQSLESEVRDHIRKGGPLKRMIGIVLNKAQNIRNNPSVFLGITTIIPSFAIMTCDLNQVRSGEMPIELVVCSPDLEGQDPLDMLRNREVPLIPEDALTVHGGYIQFADLMSYAGQSIQFGAQELHAWKPVLKQLWQAVLMRNDGQMRTDWQAFVSALIDGFQSESTEYDTLQAQATDLKIRLNDLSNYENFDEEHRALLKEYITVKKQIKVLQRSFMQGPNFLQSLMQLQKLDAKTRMDNLKLDISQRVGAFDQMETTLAAVQAANDEAHIMVGQDTIMMDDDMLYLPLMDISDSPLGELMRKTDRKNKPLRFGTVELIRAVQNSPQIFLPRPFGEDFRQEVATGRYHIPGRMLGVGDRRTVPCLMFKDYKSLPKQVRDKYVRLEYRRALTEAMGCGHHPLLTTVAMAVVAIHGNRIDNDFVRSFISDMVYAICDQPRRNINKEMEANIFAEKSLKTDALLSAACYSRAVMPQELSKIRNMLMRTVVSELGRKRTGLAKSLGQIMGDRKRALRKQKRTNDETELAQIQMELDQITVREQLAIQKNPILAELMQLFTDDPAGAVERILGDTLELFCYITGQDPVELMGNLTIVQKIGLHVINGGDAAVLGDIKQATGNFVDESTKLLMEEWLNQV